MSNKLQNSWVCATLCLITVAFVLGQQQPGRLKNRCDELDARLGSVTTNAGVAIQILDRSIGALDIRLQRANETDQVILARLGRVERAIKQEIGEKVWKRICDTEIESK